MAYIVHLSDLHFSGPFSEQGMHDALSANATDAPRLLAKQLTDDIHRLVGDKIPDAVVVSGDITYQGAAAGYKTAREFLLELTQQLPIDLERVLVVPGNHDLDNTHAATDEAFNYFRLFYQELYQSKSPPLLFPREFGHQYRILPLQAHRVCLLGFNSVPRWSKETLVSEIDQNALDAALRQVNEDKYQDFLKIAIWHHPPIVESRPQSSWYYTLKQLAQSGIQVILHGHIHVDDPIQYSPIQEALHQDKPFYFVSAGAFSAPEVELVPTYPWHYNLLEIDTGRHKRFVIYPRKKHHRFGIWETLWTPTQNADMRRPVVDCPRFANDRYPIPLHSGASTRPVLSSFRKYDAYDMVSHFEKLLGNLQKGNALIPIFGPEVNLCGRPTDASRWKPGCEFPPSSRELAGYLQTEFSLTTLHNISCPHCEVPFEQGSDVLIEKVGDLFENVLTEIQTKHYDPNPLYRRFAELAGKAIDQDGDRIEDSAFPLLITACLDRSLEHAFATADPPRPFKVVYLEQRARHCYHDPSDTEPDIDRVIVEYWNAAGKLEKERPYPLLDSGSAALSSDDLAGSPTIVRLHSPKAHEHLHDERCLLAEDQYIQFFLSQQSNLLKRLSAIGTHLHGDPSAWFIGFSLAYWSDRTLLYNLFPSRVANRYTDSSPWYAVLQQPGNAETLYWEKLNTRYLVQANLDLYAQTMARTLVI